MRFVDRPPKVEARRTPWVDALGPALFPWLTLLWKGVGLLALPLLVLHPRARRHIVGLPVPVPGLTWLHGASLGEHVAARALARYLDGPAWRTSSSWRSPVAGAFPAPLDLPFVVERWLDRARPSRLVLVEGELWPGWLEACRRRGIPVCVVNARPGGKTERLRRRALLWRWLVRDVRFVEQAETGDLKLSAEIGAATLQLGRDAFIAGSTRDGDEARVIDAWKQLPEPRPLLVLAPRHLDRIPSIEPLLVGLRWARRSHGVQPDLDVLVLDTLGELAGLYRQARAAFIGGTFDPELGGHSPAEALSAGLPVVRGPYTHANPGAWLSGFILSGDLAPAMRQALRLGPQSQVVNQAAARAALLLPPGRTPPEAWRHPWLWPLVPLWRLGVGWSQRGQPERAPVPVVSVGALSAGGAGKTPVVAWLAEQLDGAWVVGRGYGRGPGPAVRTEGDLGDELTMLARRGIGVVSAPDRLAGAVEAARRGARLVLLDDGFQHRRLHRDLDIVCIDARWPDAGGPIPVGWQREPRSALARADWVWANHGAFETDKPSVSATYEPVGWLHRGQRLPLDAVRGPVHVVCGIARPEAFVCQLLALGLEVASLRVVADHAPLGEVPPGAVVTEKDAARLPAEADVHALVLQLRVEGADLLLDAIRALCP